MAVPDNDPDPPEPPRIRMLRRLVVTLTVVTILAIVTITGLLAWRITRTAAPAVQSLPETIPLPAGERLTGFARNPAWLVLITEDAAGTQRLHLVAPGATGIHQTVTISP